MIFSRTVILFAFCLIAAVNLPMASHADPHDQDTAAITAELASEDAAVDKLDANGAVAYDTPDFEVYDVHGTRNCDSKAYALSYMSRMFGAMESAVSNTVVKSVTYDSTGATVLESDYTVFTFNRGGQDHVLKSQGTSRDFWINTQGTWLEKRTRELTDTEKLDGKPAPE